MICITRCLIRTILIGNEFEEDQLIWHLKIDEDYTIRSRNITDNPHEAHHKMLWEFTWRRHENVTTSKETSREGIKWKLKNVIDARMSSNILSTFYSFALSLKQVRVPQNLGTLLPRWVLDHVSRGGIMLSKYLIISINQMTRIWLLLCDEEFEKLETRRFVRITRFTNVTWKWLLRKNNA